MNVVEKIGTYISCAATYCRKSCCLRDIVKKFGVAREAADDNMTPARCMLDK